jgi:hypothetical protein
MLKIRIGRICGVVTCIDFTMKEMLCLTLTLEEWICLVDKST